MAEGLAEHRIQRLDAMYGLSFGGGMAVRFLTTQRIPVDRAILDAGTAPEIHIELLELLRKTKEPK